MSKHFTISFVAAIFSLGVVLMFSSCGGGSSKRINEINGEYHNVNTGERQNSYKGSVEQQNDIATLDKMIDEGY